MYSLNVKEKRNSCCCCCQIISLHIEFTKKSFIWAFEIIVEVYYDDCDYYYYLRMSNIVCANLKPFKTIYCHSIF